MTNTEFTSESGIFQLHSIQKAVSYTHLDVYKRQVFSGSNIFDPVSSLRFLLFNNARFAETLPLENGVSTGPDISHLAGQKHFL